MFDTYVVGRPQTQYVTREVNVTEKRAPTDEAVKLLSEMEEKARGRIVERLLSEAGNNTLGAVALFESYDTWKTSVTFQLNGHRIEVTFDSLARDDCLPQMAEAMGREIAKQIIGGNFLKFRKFA